MAKDKMSINDLAFFLTKLPQVSLGIEHHFSDGLYAKKMTLPKGGVAVSHKHNYNHLSILASGKAIVKTDDSERILTAPACIEITAGINHSIEALEDVTWFCIHAVDVADPTLIDKVLIKDEENICRG